MSRAEQVRRHIRYGVMDMLIVACNPSMPLVSRLNLVKILYNYLTVLASRLGANCGELVTTQLKFDDPEELDKFCEAAPRCLGEIMGKRLDHILLPELATEFEAHE